MTTTTPIVAADDLALAIDSIRNILPSQSVPIPQSFALGWLIHFVHKNVSYLGQDMDAELVFNTNAYQGDKSSIISALKTLESEGLIILGEKKIIPRTRFFTVYPRAEYCPTC